MPPFTVGIDASNIRAGGGLTYLANLLGEQDTGASTGSRVIVWGGEATLARIPSRPWIVKSYQAMLDGALASRVCWQRRHLDRLARACDVLFVPGGTYLGSFRPYVTMSHNLLPFDSAESRRYGFSLTRIRLEILRVLQSRTIRKAAGAIFLTRGAKEAIESEIGSISTQHITVPHGVDTAFVNPPRPQTDIRCYSDARPFRWLYVSIVDVYKHQWNVVAAVARLRAMGLPVALDLVGPAYPPAMRRLHKAMAEHDPDRRFVRYHGRLTGSGLIQMYHHADAFVFASTCENMPLILMEGMAAGLPMVCSDRVVMREVLRDGGEYCNPESIDDLVRAMRLLTLQPQYRAALAERAFTAASAFSWSKTALSTFAFLREIGRGEASKQVTAGV